MKKSVAILLLLFLAILISITIRFFVFNSKPEVGQGITERIQNELSNSIDKVGIVKEDITKNLFNIKIPNIETPKETEVEKVNTTTSEARQITLTESLELLSVSPTPKPSAEVSTGPEKVHEPVQLFP